jgi:predicted TIM-barrel fold metal-dependent hydrolase
MKIWDLHCHLNAPGTTISARMDALMRHADRMGIERICLFMGTPWSHHPTPAILERTNDEILEVLKTWGDRAFGFVYLNPKYQRESLDELERCVANGPMVGVKLWQGWKCSKPEILPIVERAIELQAVFFHHAWLKNREENPEASTPMELAALSARYPQFPMICGHSGGEWESGFRAIRAQPQIHAGLGGFDPTAGVVEMAVRELGPARVIFGSDAWGRSFSSQLGKVLGADVSDHIKQGILRDNLRRLLLPICTAKGMAI